MHRNIRPRAPALWAITLVVPAVLAAAGTAAAQGDVASLEDSGHALPEAREGVAALAVGDSIYLFGGFAYGHFASQGDFESYTRDILRFHPRTGVAKVGELPERSAFMAAATVDGVGYLFGGLQANDAGLTGIYRFDPSTENVTKVADLPRGVGQLAAVSDGDVVYLLGGVSSRPSTQIVRFDPRENRATLLDAELWDYPAGKGAFWIDGVAHVFGGHGGFGTASYGNWVETWSPDHAKPSVVGQAKTLVLPAVAEIGGRRYVFGGDLYPRGEGAILEFTGGTTFASVAASLPTARDSMGVAVLDGSAYLFGGRTRPGEATDEILRFSPSAAPEPEPTPAPDVLDVTVDHVGALPSPRSHAAAVAVEGRVYVFGGRDADGRPMDEVVRYDPATGAVTRLEARLPQPRHSMGGVYLSPFVYLLGGVGDEGPQPDIWIFNLTSGGFLRMGELPATKDGASYEQAFFDAANAVALGGRVYVAGGLGSYRLAEYDPTKWEPGTIITIREPGMRGAAVGRAGFVIGDAAYLVGGLARVSLDDTTRPLDYAVQTERMRAGEIYAQFGEAPVINREGIAAASDGVIGILAGGVRTGAFSARIERFDPESGQMSLAATELPWPVGYAGEAWAGDAMYLFGGENASGASAAILRVAPEGASAPVILFAWDDEHEERRDDGSDDDDQGAPTPRPPPTVTLGPPTPTPSPVDEIPFLGSALAMLVLVTVAVLTRRRPG